MIYSRIFPAKIKGQTLLPVPCCFILLTVTKRSKKRAETKFHEELITQLLALATSGFGLVAALAWNETIQQLVKEFIEPKIPGSGILSRLIYAVIITVLAVFITYQLSRLHSRFQKK